ncbi:sulfatase [Luteimonas chenhongjianii]|uniref:Sulfatase n=1 Tax=Luteimonas chenhongjianii TaxID=2006110 RepID=A0A290XBN4_9GAMM|nr:LTA synthase family protein [Luteimonas chenhongjianii]ATD66574.1 sulfatase [Luteimonas chenhongjianii]
MSRSVPRAVSALTPFLLVFVVGLALLSTSRLGLSLWHADAVGAADGWTPVLLQGLRVDVATMCMFLGVAAGLYLLLPAGLRVRGAVRVLFAAWLTLALVLPFALELATPAFMHEYGLRPNRVFVEYLLYPQEVAATLGKGHLGSSLLTLALTAIAAVLGYRLLHRAMARNADAGGSWTLRAGLAVLVLALSALGIRSTLGHRPMNPALLAFSGDATVNTLPLNSFYSVAFSVRDLLREDPGARLYDIATPDAAVAAYMRERTGSTRAASTSAPMLVGRAPAYTGRPRNLVIVLEESLGAQFVGSLGGLPLTPNYDRLSTQGWAFDQLYATGTRSVRGIEAVISGYTPTPSQATVKRPRAQGHFFTLASVLARHGYDTTFYYGGESHFDNMRGFLLANGFKRVIDRKDYVAPAFVGSWGVSDEDLFDRAHAEFTRLQAEGKPFLGFVFTSSNHDPFEFPDGRIQLHDAQKATRNNAAKYADYALGRFMDRAMASPYRDDTVFLIVADHDSRAFGRTLVPVDNFHIPGLIIAPGLAPQRDGRLVSQIDLGPTLLSLVGIADPTPMIGADLTRAQGPGRALMQYDQNFAYMTDDAMVVLQPSQPALIFSRSADGTLLPRDSAPPGLVRDATMHALWGTLAYEHGWHTLPGPSRGETAPATAFSAADKR